MDYQELVKSTVMELDAHSFDALSKAIVGEFLSFSVIQENEISKSALAEKVCDYFEKLELKTGKSFEKHIESYMSNIDAIVGRRIAKAPQPIKKDATPIEPPRARKYYNKALSIKNTRSLSPRQLTDYSRFMFCLYAEIINNNYKEIDNLNYSITCLDPDAIIDSMKNEPETDFPVLNKIRKFEIKNLYCSDTCTFIIALIVLYKLLDDKVQGEYYHE